MAVSKRTRFEVLKRDNHACRYCGATAPNVKLHVDHVIPVALGGTDKPDNLVAACKDCNAGKTSTNPNDELVADVSQKAVIWTAALRQAIDDIAEEAKERQQVSNWFLQEWAHRYNSHMGPLPNDWRTTVAEFVRMGVPIELIDEAIDITCEKGLPDRKNFRYFAGICWNHVETIQERARESIETSDENRTCGHCHACLWPQDYADTLEEAEKHCSVYGSDCEDDPSECEVCGEEDCLYHHGKLDGIQAGMQYEFNSVRHMVEHYRVCPEVDRG